MDLKIRDKFLKLWEKYFNNSDLPIIFYYNTDTCDVPAAQIHKGRSCLICELEAVRKGDWLAFNEKSIGCRGAQSF